LLAAITRTRTRSVRAGGSQPFELAVLQKLQQLGLRLERQFSHLVEKDGPAIGQLEPADLRRLRVGERAAFVAEQLAFEQRRRQGGAVDADETTAPLRAALMDLARDERLARAGLAKQQNRR
jgi:hypothetical protein